MTLFIILLGAIMGSFGNVCIYRIPRKESITYPPSHCPRCNARLSGIDLIPILSFLVLRVDVDIVRKHICKIPNRELSWL